MQLAMASREFGTVGVLLLMLLCVGSAHRLFPQAREGGPVLSQAHSNRIEHGPDSKYKSYKSTTGLFQKPASEPMDVDGHVRGLFEVSARELLGWIPLAQGPTTGPWDSDCPAEKEKQDGQPCSAAILTKYGDASSKSVRAELRKRPIIDSTYSPSHGISAPPPDEVHAIPEATPPVEVHSIPEAPPPPDEVHAVVEAPTPPDEVHAFPEAPPPDEVHAIDREEDFLGDFTNPDPEFI